MATVTYIKEKKQHLSAMRGVMRYCMHHTKTWDEQSQQFLVSGINCNGRNSILEFETTKAAHGKLDGTNFYQYVQSFSDRENITPQQAHEVAKEFAARAWPGMEVLVTTHCDTDNVHSHFVINSVSFESGLKLRQNPNTLIDLRQISDQICQAHHLSVLPQKSKKQSKGMSAREYRSAAKGESWKFRLINTIDDCMHFAGSREEFIALMKSEGYAVRWEASRKSITYTTPDGMKCRDNKLHEDKYLKEVMEYEFRIRKQLTAQENTAGIEADEKLTDETIDYLIDVNTKGTIYVTRECAKVMLSKETGSIVNVASVAGYCGNGGAAYVASKAAVIGLTKNIAMRAAASHVRCNAVCPGTVVTPMTRGLQMDKLDMDMLSAMNKHADNTLPPCMPEEVANVLLFLASDESSAVTGQVMVVDHGADL